jgi:hypothetical protein
VKVRLLPLLGVYLLASCGRDEPPPDAVELLGQTETRKQDGTFYLRAYRYQQGDRLAVVGFCIWPGDPVPKAPAFVVLYRLPGRARCPSSGRVGTSSTARAFLDQRFAPSGGSASVLRYEIAGDPLAEHWAIDGRALGGEAGRAALVDLTQSPPEVTQVQVALTELFRAGEPNPATMKAALNKLRDRREEVRKFLGQGP